LAAAKKKDDPAFGVHIREAMDTIKQWRDPDLNQSASIANRNYYYSGSGTTLVPAPAGAMTYTTPNLGGLNR
jgi:hypothetical protein